MKTRKNIQDSFFVELEKLYPSLKNNEIKLFAAWDDVLIIEKSDQGASSFNKSLLRAIDIQYVWIVENAARNLKNL